MEQIRLLREDYWDPNILAEQIAQALIDQDTSPADFVMLLINKINLREVIREVHERTGPT